MSETARTQDDRVIAIGTSLGKDKLLLLAMHGMEALGRLFQYELDLISESSPVAANDILGKNITVRLDTISGTTRYFNGFIVKFAFVGVNENGRDKKKVFSYRATLVPRLWFLTRTSDCQIFQDQTVQQIIEAVFKAREFSEYRFDLTGSYRKWEYCVQYRETDFNFVSRLMENEGMYYYFEHEDGKHTLVICDAPSAHKTVDSCPSLHFDEPDLESTDDAFIWNWTTGQEITPNKHSVTDYDPLQPRAQLENAVNVTHDHDPEPYEIFDYPGGFVAPGDGKTYANIRMEEAEARYIVAHGTSSARGIHAGALFSLADHPACKEEDYLVTAVNYQMSNDDMGLGRGGGGPAYVCQITCIPKTYEFRSPRVTPKPVVQGPQTAVVMVPDGQEIYTDKYGRVKVKFHWDRTDTMDETASCWVRVSQPAAGKKWGGISLPRKGQEVIVDFLEGDPDRPIITGRVYNGDNMPPYELPTNQTMTTFKSNSSKGGEGFNEIRLEDKKGDEQIFINGEKNVDIRLKNDRFENVGRDRNLVVERDKFEHVKNKRHELVEVDHLEEIKGDRHLKVDGKEAKEITGTKSLKVTDDVTEEFDAKHSEVTKGDLYICGDNVVLEGKTSVTIKVGSNYIAIDSSGMKLGCDGPGATLDTSSMGDTTIKSTMNINVKATLNLDMEAQVNATLKAGVQLSIQSQLMGDLKADLMLTVESSLMLQLKGSAMAQMQGGIIMIN